MSIRTRAVAVAAAAGLALTPLALTSPAQAALDNTSLAEVLLADTKKNGQPSFDDKGKDFDILTAAVLAVLDANPKSPVSALTDGDVKLTAFIPTDGGFTRTAKDLGVTAKNEEKLTGKLVGAFGVDGIEEILLYHVVVGARINAGDAAKADGAKLEMANGQTVKVNVKKNGSIFLIDKAKDLDNAQVIITNINKGNKQLAHGINRVLLPKLPA